MNRNMGIADRSIRILAAIAIAILYFTHILSGTVAIILLIIAGVFILTSFIGNCPLYSLLGIRTSRRTD